ncbi:uncharacterized protein LOC114288509, partial [Camellia sinensis]|uniref:uncharacterized protein LOC114288509 n=1 Tax=Camellia sinensis TaxID=4442 RepID=UPI001036634D
MKPPTFLGGIEPLKAKTWLLEMENLFEVFSCSEVQKGLLATYTLKDEARRDRKVSEFEELKQGRMSVAEYKAKFTKLARFAPHMVDTDYKKARKFEGGLDLEVFDRVGVLKLPTYVEVLNKSLMAEATLATMKQSKAPVTTTTDWRGKRSRYGFRRGRSHMSKKQNTGTTSSSSQSSGSIPTGHAVKDCLPGSENTSRPMVSSVGSASTAKTNARANTGKKPLRQGRVFALVPGDVQNIDTVVS